ncbi:MAG: archaellin/type IV pilin N-terminal domain-containing protein [Ignisphaera sp.]
MKNKLYKGIEPIIAVVILVAITLVIAIGVIGWIMGWWGTFGATETLKIYPDSKLYTDGTVNLHVANEGSASAVIFKVEIVGVGENTTTVTLAPGEETTINASVKGDLTPGARYVVKVYTKAGNVYSITLTAEQQQQQSGSSSGSPSGSS